MEHNSSSLQPFASGRHPFTKKAQAPHVRFPGSAAFRVSARSAWGDLPAAHQASHQGGLQLRPEMRRAAPRLRRLRDGPLPGRLHCGGWIAGSLSAGRFERDASKPKKHMGILGFGHLERATQEQAKEWNPPILTQALLPDRLVGERSLLCSTCSFILLLVAPEEGPCSLRTQADGSLCFGGKM